MYNPAYSFTLHKPGLMQKKMGNYHYMRNRQKLLFMVKELHKSGFENLRIVPSVSPSGLSWRCEFITNKGELYHASDWISRFEEDKKEIKHSPQELADIFLRENLNFLNKCKGDNNKYVQWYKTMIESLKDNELPYAFSDYFSPSDYWETSEGNKIMTLPGEKDYYFDY